MFSRNNPSDYTKNRVLALVLVSILGGLIPMIPMVLAETTPTVQWTTNYTDTFFNGNGGCQSGTSRGQGLDVEWLTGDAMIAQQAGTATGAAISETRFKRVDEDDGATTWTFTLGANYDTGGCDVALDQRGRVYGLVAAGSNPGTLAQVNILRFSNGDTLGELELADGILSQDGGGNEELGRVITDKFRETSSSGTRFALGDTIGFSLWASSGADTSTYTKTCDNAGLNGGSSSSDMVFSRKPLQTDRLYAHRTGDDDVSRVSTSDCSTVNTVVVDVGNNIDFSSVNSRPESYFFSGMDLTRKRLNEDSSAVSGTDSLTLFDGATPNAIANVEIDDGEDYIMCGVGLYSGQEVAFLTKIASDWSAFDWMVTLNAGDFRSVDCQPGLAGDVFWALDGIGNSLATLKKYCCSVNSVFDVATEQIGTPSATTPVTGPITTGADIATGTKNFFVGIGCGTPAALFFCGLTLVVSGMAVAGAATGSFTKGRGVVVAVAVGGLGMAIFNGLADIWPTWTAVVLIVIVAFIVVNEIRKRFAGGGDVG